MAVDPFADECCCAIIKHTTPCGVATGATLLEFEVVLDVAGNDQTG